MNRRTLIFTALALLLLGLGLVAFLRKGISELPVYTVGGERLIEGQEIYRPSDAKPFTYPPFFAVVFAPFALIPDSAHRTVWYFVTVASLVAVLWILRECLLVGRQRTRKQTTIFWILLVALAGRHVSSVIENQSHDLIVLLLVMLGIRGLQMRRESLGGAWIGLAAACKATPLLFLPSFIWQLRARAALGLLLVLIGACLLPDALSPRTDGRLWAVAWSETFLEELGPGRPAEASGAWRPDNALNQNLAGTLHRLFTEGQNDAGSLTITLWHLDRQVLRILTIAAQVLVLAWLGFVIQAGRVGAETVDSLRRFGEAGAILCGMLLLSPMSSKSHFSVLLVPLGYCLAELIFRGRQVVAAMLLGVAFVLGPLSAKGLLGRPLGQQLLDIGTVTWATVAILVATGLLLRRDRARAGLREHPAAGPP